MVVDDRRYARANDGSIRRDGHRRSRSISAQATESRGDCSRQTPSDGLESNRDCLTAWVFRANRVPCLLGRDKEW